MANKTRCLLYMGFILSAGCSTLSVNIPLPEVQSPEVVGETSSGQVGVGFTPSTYVEISTNANNRPPSTATPTTRRDANVPLLFDLGLGDRFQVGMRSGARSGFTIGGKYQVFGSPVKTATKGNNSFAIYGTYGQVSGNSSGDQAVNFGPGGFPWTAKATVGIGGVGASYGARVSDNLMLYVGHAQDWYTGKGEISHSISTDGSSPAASYNFTQSGESSFSAFGLMTGKMTTFSAQVGYRHSEWTQTKKIFGVEYAVAGKFGF